MIFVIQEKPAEVVTLIVEHVITTPHVLVHVMEMEFVKKVFVFVILAGVDLNAVFQVSL